MRIGATYAIAAAVIGAIAFGSYAMTYGTRDSVEVVIDNTDRECSGNQDCRYMIYTPDEVFKNVDSWMFFKFNSTDYHNKIKVGKQYRLTVTGWRIPLLSMYRNVVDYEQIQ